MEDEPLDERGSAVRFMLHHPSTTIPPLLISLPFFGFTYLFSAGNLFECLYRGAPALLFFFGLSYAMVLNNLRVKKRFQSALVTAASNSPAIPGAILSSADIALSPKYVSVRWGTENSYFMAISVMFVVVSYSAVLNGASLPVLIAAFVSWCVCYVSVAHFLIHAKKRNFYFKCDDTEIEIRTGIMNQKTAVRSYDQITDVEIWQERRSVGRSGVHLLDLYDVSITANGSLHLYGGFTQEDGQKIIDFILPRIKSRDPVLG